MSQPPPNPAATPTTAPLPSSIAETVRVPERRSLWPLLALPVLLLAVPLALRARPRAPTPPAEEVIDPARLAGLWPVRAARLIGPSLYVDLGGCDGLNDTRRQGLGEFFLMQLARPGVTEARLRCGGQTYHVPLRHLFALVVPITVTIRDFLASGATDEVELDAMYQAWFKAVTLSATLWARPYSPDLW